MRGWRGASRMSEREKEALYIVRRLVESGFRAVLAGGCVRDRILGVEPKDYDIATDARPEVVQKMFDRTVGGRREVRCDRRSARSTTNPSKSRRSAPMPNTPMDAGRRRCASARSRKMRSAATSRIDGMFYDPIADRLIDLVGGMRDLRAGIIRAIGNPYERFEEDHLRILRAVRFAARLNFTIDPATWDAMKVAAPKIVNIAAERIGEEIVMMMTEGAAARAMDLMMDSGLMQILLPEVVRMRGCEQPENFHPEGDVYTHTRIGVAMLPANCTETVAFGILLHDIAKPQVPRGGRRQGHVLWAYRRRCGDGGGHARAAEALARGAGARRVPGEESSEAVHGAADASVDAQADARGRWLRRIDGRGVHGRDGVELVPRLLAFLPTRDDRR